MNFEVGARVRLRVGPDRGWIGVVTAFEEPFRYGEMLISACVQVEWLCGRRPRMSWDTGGPLWFNTQNDVMPVDEPVSSHTS